MLSGEPSDALLFLLAALATWRLSSLLVYESGPANMAITLRRWLVAAGAHKLATCFHCASAWMAIGVVALVYRPSGYWPVLMAAAAGAAAILELQLRGDPRAETTELTDE